MMLNGLPTSQGTAQEIIMARTTQLISRCLGRGLSALLMCTLSGPVAAQTCLQPQTGLVSWWDGDAVSETTATDLQDGHNGTLKNGTTTAPGMVGQAFSFDGTNDFLEVINVDFAQGDYSIDGWFNAFDLTVPQTIFGAIVGSPGTETHAIAIILNTNCTLRYLHRFPPGASGGTTSFPVL
jgi:hypothetical protein